MAQKTIIRTSVGLEEAQHRRVQELAEQNDVSVAWVIRHAVGRFLEECHHQKLVPLTTAHKEVRQDAV